MNADLKLECDCGAQTFRVYYDVKTNTYNLYCDGCGILIATIPSYGFEYEGDKADAENPA